jgi:AI-2 transport protein TqsA
MQPLRFKRFRECARRTAGATRQARQPLTSQRCLHAGGPEHGLEQYLTRPELANGALLTLELFTFAHSSQAKADGWLGIKRGMMDQTGAVPAQSAARRSGAANATIVIAVILVGAALYFLQSLLAPLLAAAFMLIVIGGLSRLIRRIAPLVPRFVAMGVAVIIILAMLAGAIWIAVDNIGNLIADADQYAQRLNVALSRLQSAVGIAAPDRLETFLGRVEPSRVAAFVASWVQVALSSTGFMLIYLGFMMASGRTFTRKLLAITGAREGLENAQAMFERIREAVGGYIWVQTATGLAIAVLSWALLAAFEIPSPLFWAFVIFVTSYVPIVGGIVGVLLPVAFAFAVSDNLTTPLILLAGLQFIQVLIGNVLQPRMQGSQLNIDPVVVLLSLGVWGFLLGPVGAFLSTPLTVTAMVILAQFPRTVWMAILLSEDSRPDSPPAESA